MPGSRRALLSGILGLLAACRVAPPRRCRGREPPRGVDAPDDALVAAGGAIDGDLDAGSTARLDAALTAMHTATRAPGVSAAVAVAGRGCWSRQLGLALADPATPLAGSARFQAASIGKLMTAVTILRMVERGQLTLDARLERWFPDFPDSAYVTIDQLLRHTGGVHDFTADARDEDDNLRYRDPTALIAEAAAGAPAFCPGTAWGYSNTGYVMLGRIAEAVGGAPFARVLATEVFAPAGLRDTAVNVPRVQPAVRGHRGGVALPASIDHATPFSAGGVAASAADLVRLLHATLAGSLLRPTTVRRMLTNMLPMFGDPRQRYGAGIMLYTIPEGPGTMIGHSGGARGCRAVVAYLPADTAYVAVLFNDEIPAEAGLWALVRALRANP